LKEAKKIFIYLQVLKNSNNSLCFYIALNMSALKIYEQITYVVNNQHIAPLRFFNLTNDYNNKHVTQ